MLISVTNFFRDPEAFESLEKRGLESLVEQMPPDSAFRLWVPGCATGEEAYSLAMLLVEIMEKNHKHFNVQIFATDIDEEAIEQARQAIYPDSISVDVSPERLKRFFLREENFYRINKSIREMVIFSSQNLIKDPPFSKLNLVSCRNVLIYMDQILQKKLLPLFHYTLNPEGILFLGSSESIGEFTELFSTIDSKWKIFKRLSSVPETPIEYPRIFFHGQVSAGEKVDENFLSPQTDLRRIAEKIILEKFSLPCLLINAKYDILYFNGDTSHFLIPPMGEPSFNLLKMIREELRLVLNTVLIRAVKQHTTVTQENIRVRHNGFWLSFNLTVQPLTGAGDSQRLFMVVFQDKKLQKTNRKKTKDSEKGEVSQQIKTLEQELHSTKEYLQTTIEELETTNEELKSSNEELQSTNEELQSTNEELETSKEELQSTNEELITVNFELQSKVDELSRANNDINNLLASTEIGTIFLDTRLRIKRFTPTMTKIFNLIVSDIDRPISDITSNIEYQNFAADAQLVLDTLIPKEVIVRNQAQRFFSTRIVPYRTLENRIDGVVITFVDITKIHQAEMAERLVAVVQDSNDAVTVQMLDGRITAWNKGAERMYGYLEEEALQMNVLELVPEGKKQETREMMQAVKTGKTVSTFETERLTKTGRILRVSLTITKLMDEAGKVTAFATTERDLSETEKLISTYENRIRELERMPAKKS